MSLLTRRVPVVPRRGVHLDLKGNPPTPARLLSLLEVFRKARLDVVLAEWEDTFPWRRYPDLRSPTAYGLPVVQRFHARARALGLEVIPLVQCFGHSENVLRLKRFRHLREVPDDLGEYCPTHPGSARLVIELVDDVLAGTGPGLRHVHLGGDEAWHMGSCARCRAAIRRDGRAGVYLRHVTPVLDHLAAHGIRPILWDDMMRGWPESALRDLARKADLMAWSYAARPIGRDAGFLHEGHLAKYARAGVTTWGASAYKGGDGPFLDVPDLPARIANNLAWARAARDHRLAGVVATAWSRYNTFMGPCETIEASLHALVITAAALWDGNLPADADREARRWIGRTLGRSALRRFEACFGAARGLRDWADGFEKWFLSERERAAHLTGEPDRINPGAMRNADRKIRAQLASGRRHGAAFIAAHRGLIPDRWLKLYAESRLRPLERRVRNLRKK